MGLDHHGKSAAIGVFLDVPSRDPDQLPEGVGAGCGGHLLEAKIDPVGEKNRQETDAVAAGGAGPEIGEGLREADGLCIRMSVILAAGMRR